MTIIRNDRNAAARRNAEAAKAAPEEEPETPLEMLLCELSAGGSLCFLDADSDLDRNRSALESRLRQGLDLLR